VADRSARNDGLVVAAHGQRGILETADGQTLAYLVKGKRLRVVCGDRVKWVRAEPDGLTIIEKIVSRNNVLERREPGRAAGEILAANLSCLIVVFAPLPKPDWFLIDRYLCTGTLMGCKLLLVGNKNDLNEPNAGNSMEAEINDYIAAGYEYLSVSATSGDRLNELDERLRMEIGILVGQSGAGKSSLINRLVPDANIATRAVSKSTAEGTHTTTASAMHRLPGGGRLIDSPGVRDFVPAIDGPNDAEAGYPEIIAAARSCRFSNCRHLREPDCAVKEAMDAGQISARRYESYKRLLRSLSD
jgi:ribosome biogenesis GTPase